VAKIITPAREIYEAVIEKFFGGKSTGSWKQRVKLFRYLIIEELKGCGKYLPLKDVVALAKLIGIPYAPLGGENREKHLGWYPTLSNLFFDSLQYIDPKNPQSSILHAKNEKDSFSVIPHTIENGFQRDLVADAFPETIKQVGRKNLEDMMANFLQEATERKGVFCLTDANHFLKGFGRNLFKKKVSENLQEINLDSGIIKIIHGMLGMSIPSIDHLCETPTKISLPKTGFGIRYELTNQYGDLCEIRLSPAKPTRHTGHHHTYITITLLIDKIEFYIAKKETKNNCFYYFGERKSEEVHIRFTEYSHNSLQEFMNSNEYLNGIKKIISKDGFEKRMKNKEINWFNVCQNR
jgi:hypothetical protein